MMTKIEVTKTYWIGVSSEQRKDLTDGILQLLHNDNNPQDQRDLSTEQAEAVSTFRQALLNV